MPSPETDWNDIGSIANLFAYEKAMLQDMERRHGGKPGRNFWKEAADEIDRLRKLKESPDEQSRQKATERRAGSP